MKSILKIFITTLSLSFVANAYAVKAKDYQKAINKPGITVVELWAPWCGNCAVFKPTYNSIKRKYAKKIRFIEVNTDEVDNPEATFGLKYGLPTLIMFKDGVEVSRLPGGGNMQDVTEWLNSNK